MLSLMNIKRVICHWVFIIIIMNTITACGFHLRGNKPLPLEMQVLSIESSSPYQPLTLALTQILRSMGITIVNSPDEAPVTLKIFHELYTSTPFSESASTKIKQYTMHYTFDYQLQDKHRNIILGPKHIASQQIYTVNEETVLSTGHEQATIRNEIQRSAVFRLISQLSSPETAKILQAHQHARGQDETTTRTTTATSR